MANSILSSLRSKASLSIANSTNSSDDRERDVAKGLVVTKINIKYRSRTMRHMLENGTGVVDTRVIDPTIIDMEVICPTLDELNLVNQMLQDRKNTYNVTTKSIVVNDMVCDNFQVMQSSGMLSASPVRITMKQLRRQGADSKRLHQVVEQPPDSSVLGLGIQRAQQVTSNVQETFRRFLGG